MHKAYRLVVEEYGCRSLSVYEFCVQLAVGLQAIDGLAKKYGTRFPVGNIAEMLGGLYKI